MSRASLGVLLRLPPLKLGWVGGGRSEGSVCEREGRVFVKNVWEGKGMAMCVCEGVGEC